MVLVQVLRIKRTMSMTGIKNNERSLPLTSMFNRNLA
jgi:hypothetical protein